MSRSYVSAACIAVLMCSRPPAMAQEQPANAPLPLATTRTEPKGFLPEPGSIERAAVFGDRNLAGSGSGAGWYVDFGKMVPGAGWLAAGPGYRRWFANDHIFTDASAAMSWHGYKTAQARVELPRLLRSRLVLGSAMRLQDFPQMDFYAPPSVALSSDPTEYRMKSSNYVGYATVRPREWLAIGADAGVLTISLAEPGGIFKSGRPATQAMFPDDVAFAHPEPAFMHTGLSIAADTRDFVGHPTRGGVYRVAAANYRDRDAGLFSFRRYEAEAAQFIPLADSRIVFALRGWMIGSDTSDGQAVPFYLQPNLGGSSSLRGYRDYRFHDRNMLLLNAEARVAMMTHVDAAVFLDAGNVAARFGDLNIDQRSYGFGLRLHSRRDTFARIDVARGSEGWRLLFRLNEPFTLSRLLRRTAPVPVVP